MIIYDGEKYACVSCIRGHRSSTCRHTSRMLVKVRSRGRHASLDIRKVIIVDTESQVTPDEDSPACDTCCDSGGDLKECEKMNKQPILFLRTIRMQKAVLIDGKLKIIVEEKEEAGESSDNGKHPLKYISEKEFLRQNSISLKNHNTGSICSCKPSKSNDNANGMSQLKVEFQEADVWKAEKVDDSSSLSDNNGLGKLMEAVPTETCLNTRSIDAVPTQPYLNAKPMFELLTHRGLYLSTECSCKDGLCQCSNCLLHRNEDELNSYIQRSGVPLTNLGEAQLANQHALTCANKCKCSAEECQCDGCPEHPTEIIAFNRFIFFGILNVKLKRKTVINFKGRLIPSQYWWDFLKLQVPLMSETQLDYLDITNWFEKIVATYNSQLLDTNEFHLDVVNSMFNV